MIRVSGLTKDYGNRRAIDNLNFNIEKGDEVNYFNLQSYLKPHFIPVAKQSPAAQQCSDVVENTELVKESVPAKLKISKKNIINIPSFFVLMYLE